MLEGAVAFRPPAVIAVLALLLASGCGRRSQPQPSHRIAASSVMPSARPEPPPIERSERLPPRATPAAEDEAPDDAILEASLFSFDELNDVGPAGPATAHESGVVMITRGDEIALARRVEQGPGTGSGAIAPVSRETTEFLAVARGPAVAGPHAYWISRGRLLRGRLDGDGALEVLAEGARDGTRVAAAADGKRAMAAYISRPAKEDEPPQAKLWIEGGKTLDLCPEGAGASSVALSRTAKSLIALFIDGRSGMTPVHARPLIAEPSGLRLGADVVVWVTGPAQASTEITATGSARGHWAFIPMERDVTHFGLAQIEIGHEPRMDVPVTWRTYPNGLDLAPVSAADVCGFAAVLYVRPAGEAPGSAQSLHLAALGRDGPAGSEIVATARGFANVSLSALPGGAILAYVADRRTWARTLRCKPAQSPRRPP